MRGAVGIIVCLLIGCHGPAPFSPADAGLARSDAGVDSTTLPPPPETGRVPLRPSIAEGGWWLFHGSFEETYRDSSGTRTELEAFDLLMTLGSRRGTGPSATHAVTVETRGQLDVDGEISEVRASGTDLDQLDGLAISPDGIFGTSRGRTVSYFDASGLWSGRLLLSQHLDANFSTTYALFAGRLESYTIGTPDGLASRSGRAYTVILEGSESGCSADYDLGIVICGGDSVYRAQYMYVDPALGPTGWVWRYQYATPDYSVSSAEEGAIVLVDASPDAARPAPRIGPVPRFGACGPTAPCEPGLECVARGAGSRCMPESCASCRAMAASLGLTTDCLVTGERGMECSATCEYFPPEDTDCVLSCTASCPGEMRCVGGRCE